MEFHETLYESELASYVRDEEKNEWCGAGVGRVQQCGRFPCPWPARRWLAVRLCCTCRISVSGRSLPGLYHSLFLHVWQQDMLVVLPFRLLFRSTPRGEG